MQKVITLLIIAVLFLASCQKDKNDSADKTINDINSLVVDQNFDWKMSKDISFSIFNKTKTSIEITTPDESVVYFKGEHPGNNETLKITVSIPCTENQVLINGDLYDISSGGITVESIRPTQIEGPDIKGYSDRDVMLTNYCLLFDGVNDKVSLGDISELNSATEFTIEGWANQTSNLADAFIFTKVNDATNDIMIRTVSGNFVIDLGNGSDSYASWGGYSGVTSGTWFHWAVVYDGAGATDADRLKLYINGNATPVALSFTGTIPATSSNLAGYGALLTGAADWFAGYMDEVRVWSVARTGAEINANYDVILDGSTTNLVAAWRMDEGTGTVTDDETTTYDATIDGCTWTLYANGFDSDSDGTLDLNDDYPLDATRAFDNFFPAADTGTLVFEDVWPCWGDYDFNDVVMGYQFKTVTNTSNEVVEIFATFVIKANGAANYGNGFGFELPDAVAGIATNVEISGYNHTAGIITVDGTTKLETGQTNPVIIAIDNINSEMEGANTQPAQPYVTPVTFTVKIDVTGGGPFTAGDFSLTTWNPFIYVYQIRDHEVHLADMPGTDLLNTNLYGTCNDSTVVSSGLYYKSATALPWALDFPVDFEYPNELSSIDDAYLHFVEWAESGGTLFTDWYSNTAVGYRNTAKIYNQP